jgi:hypothetical protein
VTSDLEARLVEYAAHVDELSRADQMSRVCGAFGARPRRWRWPGRRIVAGVVVAVVASSATLAGAIALTRDEPEEGVRTEKRDHQMSQWLHEYDPAEIAYLRRQATQNDFADVDDYALVATLEFRRACREVRRAEALARSQPRARRTALIDSILAPQIGRLRDRRTTDHDESAAMFTRLADLLKVGDDAAVDDRLEGPRGDCKDALDWHP